MHPTERFYFEVVDLFFLPQRDKREDSYKRSRREWIFEATATATVSVGIDLLLKTLGTTSQEPIFGLAPALTWHSVDGSQRSQHADRPHRGETDVLQVERVLQHPATGGERGGGEGERERERGGVSTATTIHMHCTGPASSSSGNKNTERNECRIVEPIMYSVYYIPPPHTHTHTHTLPSHCATGNQSSNESRSCRQR